MRMKPRMEPITIPAIAPPLRVAPPPALTSVSAGWAITVMVSARRRTPVAGRATVNDGRVGILFLTWNPARSSDDEYELYGREGWKGGGRQIDGNCMSQSGRAKVLVLTSGGWLQCCIYICSMLRMLYVGSVGCTTNNR